MANSIALPCTPDPLVAVRCFLIFEFDARDPREVTAYSFTRDECTALWLENLRTDELYGFKSCWASIMFFPEAWPPELINDYLRSPTWQERLPGIE